MEETLAIRGRVLDPDGKPFSGARIYACPQDNSRNSDPLFAPGPPSPDATSDAEGGFHFTIPDPGLHTIQVRATWGYPTIAALAPGFGPAWATFTTPDEARELTLRLVQDDVPIVGRVVDLEGRPVPGATIRPVGLYANPGENLDDWEAAMARSKDLSDGAMGLLSRWLPVFRLRRDLAATTDADGRFRLTGIGRERVASLWIEGPTIATSFLSVHARTRPGPTYILPMHLDQPRFGKDIYHGATSEYVMAPTRPIEGTVRDKDTGRPLAGILIRSYRFAGNDISGRDHVRTTTGPDGRYRLMGMPPGSGNRITAGPVASQPYLAAGADVPGGAGPQPATVDFSLKRGVAIRGKVTDKATGQPVPAFVEYFALATNSHRDEARELHGEAVKTRPDGTFELVGLPGRGLIGVRAEKDYYPVGQGAEAIPGANPDGNFPTFPHMCDRDRVHAIVAIEPAEGAGVLTCDVALDPGLTITGTVVGPDGQPVAGCMAIDLCPHTMSFNSVRLATAEFTARGLDPKHPRPLVFRHDEKQLTAVLMATGRKGTPVTVRLQPAASVTGRLLDDDGQPRHDLSIDVRYADGHFGPGFFYSFLKSTVDRDGRFRVEGLIPGVPYVLAGRASMSIPGYLASDLRLRPGEARNLGDVRIQPHR